MGEYDLPKKLKYNEDYTWVELSGDVATLGVIGPAAESVQEFVFIMLPKVGQKIKKGEKYVSLEAVKWSGQLKSPVSGEVVEVNDSVYDEPDMINKEAYKNWIAKIKMSDKKELDELKSNEEIKAWVEKKLG